MLSVKERRDLLIGSLNFSYIYKATSDFIHINLHLQLRYSLLEQLGPSLIHNKYKKDQDNYETVKQCNVGNNQA